MNSLRRPHASDRRPKMSAPKTSPSRDTVPVARPTELEDMWRAWGSLSVAAIELATVISRPSRTQATPSAMTSLVWKLDHGRRSMRAGMVLRMVPRSPVTGASAAAVMRPYCPLLRTNEHVAKLRHTSAATTPDQDAQSGCPVRMPSQDAQSGSRVLEALYAALLAQALLQPCDVLVVGGVDAKANERALSLDAAVATRCRDRLRRRMRCGTGARMPCSGALRVGGAGGEDDGELATRGVAAGHGERARRNPGEEQPGRVSPHPARLVTADSRLVCAPWISRRSTPLDSAC